MGSDPGPLGHLGPEVGAVQPGQEGRGLGRRGWACRGGGSGTGLPGCGDPCPRPAKLQLGFQEEAGTSWDLWYPGPGAGGVYLRLGGGQPWRGEGTPGACPCDPVQPSLLSRARPPPKRPRSPWRAVQPGSWGPFSLGRCSVAWGPRGHGRGGQRECQRGRPPHPCRMLPAGCGLQLGLWPRASLGLAAPRPSWAPRAGPGPGKGCRHVLGADLFSQLRLRRAQPSYREAKRPSSARLPRASLPPVAPEEHPGRALVSTPGPCPGPALPCTALHTSPRLTPSRLWSAVPSPLCLVNTDSSPITDAAGLPCTSAHPAPGAALSLAVRGQGH